MNDEIYEMMYESEGHRARIRDVDGNVYTGFVSTFESRLDNEDDDNEWAGQGSICFHTDDGGGILMYEAHVKEITIIR